MLLSENFGSVLKRERELRGISLEEISQNTCIRLSFLEAIEQNQLHKIPGLTFLKGFVKSYVQYVGLDDEEIQEQLKVFLREASVHHPKSSQALSNVSKWQLLGALTLILMIILWIFK